MALILFFFFFHYTTLQFLILINFLFADYMAKEMVVMDKKYASNNLRIEDKWADKHADIQRLRHHLATPGL